LFAYTFVILPCHFLILSADGHRWVEAIFVGWLASATILDKALETWMHRLHHDASTGFRLIVGC
jgi:RsiW-degrading membrane proteinase PrsW (M82 family)